MATSAARTLPEDMRALMEQAVERLIALMDLLDAIDEDLEDGADAEADDADDEDSADDEPYLGAGDDREFDEGESGIADWDGLCEQISYMRGASGERVE